MATRAKVGFPSEYIPHLVSYTMPDAATAVAVVDELLCREIDFYYYQFKPFLGEPVPAITLHASHASVLVRAIYRAGHRAEISQEDPLLPPGPHPWKLAMGEFRGVGDQ